MRTFRLAHGLVRCNINTRGEDASFTDVKIKPQIENETRRCEWRYAPEAWAEIWEKAGSWVLASEEEGWLSELGEARGLCAQRALRVGWVESWRCKSSQHRKIVSLSPHVEKPLNSKRWIKVSYLNQFREFYIFGIPLYEYEYSMHVSHIHILVVYLAAM